MNTQKLVLRLLWSGILCLICGTLSLLGAQPSPASGQMIINSYDFSGKLIPHWKGDTLVSLEDSGVAHFFDRQGQEVATIALSIPGANLSKVHDAAHHPNGTVALCGYATDESGKFGHFLAIVPPNGQPTKIIRTDPYAPQKLAIAQDGTIWTQGFEGPLRKGASNTNNGVIRHFDSSGVLLGSFLSQASIPSENFGVGVNNLAASPNLVGWYQGRGQYYWEVAFNGTVKKYAPVPGCGGMVSDVIGLAITDGGQAFVTRDCIVNRLHQRDLFLLDRVQGTWRPVALPDSGDPVTTNVLLGSYGDALVRHGNERGSFVLSDASQVSPR